MRLLPLLATAAAAMDSLTGQEGPWYGPLLQARRPTWVPGSAAAGWGALREPWSVESVVAALEGPSVPCQRSATPFFMYFDVGVPGLLDDEHALDWAAAEVVDLAKPAFLSSLLAGAADEFVYFTEELEAAAPALAAGVAGWDGLLVHDAQAEHDEAPFLSLWVGSAGVVTQTHYDAPHNIFVQVAGRKRFTVWPPEAHRGLYLFPELHKRARKAQAVHVNGSLAAPERFPRALELPPPLVFEVGPGDVFYLPPCWFHRVETLEASVSVNLFAASEEASRFSELLGLPLPFEESWTEAETAAGALQYLRRLVAPRVAADLLELRYLAAPSACALPASGGPGDEAKVREYAEAARRVLARLRELGGEGLAELALHQYVELLANFAGGGLEGVRGFVSCLAGSADRRDRSEL